MARHNWEYIEEFYIRGKVDPATGESMDLSMGDICKAFNIGAKSTVKNHIDKDNWRAKREEYKAKLNKTIKERMEKMDIEDFMEFRKRLMKLGLGELLFYGKELEAGNIEIKPVDIDRTRKWLLDQYYLIFGVPQAPPPTTTPDQTDEPAIQINIGTKNDLHNLANNLRNGS